MGVSGFENGGFCKNPFDERDLAEMAAALGMSYEIEYDVPASKCENKSYHIRASVKMKGLQSKRYAVFRIYNHIDHTKRINVELELLYRKPLDCKDALLPKDVRRIRDEAASAAVTAIMQGCSVKISKTRRIVVPPASSIEEFKLKMAVAGGNI